MDSMVGKHSVGLVGKRRLDDAIAIGDTADAKIMSVKVTVLIKQSPLLENAAASRKAGSSQWLSLGFVA